MFDLLHAPDINKNLQDARTRLQIKDETNQSRVARTKHWLTEVVDPWTKRLAEDSELMASSFLYPLAGLGILLVGFFVSSIIVSAVTSWLSPVLIATLDLPYTYSISVSEYEKRWMYYRTYDSEGRAVFSPEFTDVRDATVWYEKNHTDFPPHLSLVYRDVGTRCYEVYESNWGTGQRVTPCYESRKDAMKALARYRQVQAGEATYRDLYAILSQLPENGETQTPLYHLYMERSRIAQEAQAPDVAPPSLSPLLTDFEECPE